MAWQFPTPCQFPTSCKQEQSADSKGYANGSNSRSCSHLGTPLLDSMNSDYGFTGHPLRKDFPLTGYSEVSPGYSGSSSSSDKGAGTL
jgi:hypothetical protein